MPLAQRDLDFVLERARDDFAAFRGARIFITGGTGFVGKWMVGTLLEANRRLSLRTSLVLLTRDPVATRISSPALIDAADVLVVAGDVRTFKADFGTADAIVHAATPASARISAEAPGTMLDTIIEGGRSVMAYAERCGPIPLLFTSSGAVYGRQPPHLSHVDEEYPGAPDALAVQNAYHEGKRCAELQCAIGASRGIRPKIARLFAFVGPHLPLDRHFAIGNFLRDALAGDAIAVNGDGSPLRSYLYAADMAIWLWRIFARGHTLRAYNVGSEIAYSIRATAERVAAAAGAPARVTVAVEADPGVLPERYVPSTRRARTELDLNEWTSLEEAIQRTLAWHRANSNSN